ncbi:dimethylsulfonioproprionate lyase family protein [Agromyces silvae]|uniref:dimethylsulfonioproprionate lyase family protein n=1 Tax=Agromyces silvae TaxID=3388266 RepID=UPI00280C1DB9|nr:dimethylsulfonioproprionate lyase family protein [Agromyces protaetiae]
MNAAAPNARALVEAVSLSLRQVVTTPSMAWAHERVFGTGALTFSETAEVSAHRQPACDFLAESFARLDDVLRQGTADARLHQIALLLRALEPRLHWTLGDLESELSDPLTQNYAEAAVVGPNASVTCDTVEVRILVMGPHSTYPEHSHALESLTLVLSEGEWRRARGAWFRPGTGGVAWNPGGITHAMRTHREPMLAIRCLGLPAPFSG